MMDRRDDQMAAGDSNDTGLTLHRLVFEGDVDNVVTFLQSMRSSKVNTALLKKDIHGNTPLHLAAMLGNVECVQELLSFGAQVRQKNNEGWNCLSEALSFGDRRMILMMLKKLHSQARQTVEMRRPELVQALCQMPDFYMQIKWDFHSWVPLVSRILPSDVCRIHKKGARLRMDSTLLDFKDMSWDRGDISHLFNGHAAPKNSLLILDNRTREYKRCQYQETAKEVEEEADILMSSDIMVAQLNTDKVQFERSMKGWLWKENRTERIGSYHSQYYSVTGLTLESRKRREHLTDDDLKKNKEILETFARGHISQDLQVDHRESVPPPNPCSMSWSDYLATHGQAIPSLRRRIRMKENTKSFRASLAMCEDFPIAVTELLDVLEVIAPLKHFSRLREFLVNRLPPGFPVRVELPVFPTITAKITFQEFTYRDDIDDDLFVIPPNYKRSHKNFNL